jgi:hypothetical protein
MSEKLPCQKVHYLHHIMGGPADGDTHPSQHLYELRHINGVAYVRDGEPEPMQRETSWQAITVDDDYSEPLWQRVNMRPAPKEPTP